MNGHPSDALLNDYVDGELDAGQRAELERHLGHCVACRTAVDEIRTLVGQAAALPPLPPARDLLPQIRRATRVEGARLHRWGALAASLLVVASAAIGALILQQREAPQVVERPVSGAPGSSQAAAVAELRAAERAFAEAARILLETLESRREEIPEAALVALEENIALIDRSIDEVRASLDSDGVNMQSERTLTALYEQKMQLLWKVSRLSS
jgi:anti-sigma factor RsiW